MIPQFNFFGVDYPGLESNTVYVFYEKPVVNQPPIIEIKELYEDFHPVATLEGFVKDDEKVEEVIIDWGDGNREKIIENFDYIYREHLYETTGDFRITVKAIDNRGAFSIETISDVSITKLTTSTVNAGPDEYIIVEKNLNLPSSLGGQEVQSISPTKNYLLRKDATAYLRAAYKVPAYGEYSGDPWEIIHYKVFDCWGGDLEGTENHVRLVLDRDKKVIAYFKDIYFEPPAGTNYIKIINHLYQSYSPWMSAIKVYPKEIVRHICDNIYYYSPGTRVCIEYIFDVDELEYAPFNYEYFPFNPDDDEAWLLENLNIIIRGESGARYTGSDGIVDAVFLWEEGKIYLYVTLVENMIVEKNKFKGYRKYSFFVYYCNKGL